VGVSVFHVCVCVRYLRDTWKHVRKINKEVVTNTSDEVNRAALNVYTFLCEVFHILLCHHRVVCEIFVAVFRLRRVSDCLWIDLAYGVGVSGFAVIPAVTSANPGEQCRKPKQLFVTQRLAATIINATTNTSRAKCAR